MKLVDILHPARIRTGFEARSKGDVLSALAGLFVLGDPRLDQDDVREVLGARERLATTGVGGGVAVPHGRLAQVDCMQAALLVSASGVPFEAIDGEAVYILIGVLAPAQHTVEHLKILARVSRLVRGTGLCERLRCAGLAEDPLRIVAAEEQSL